VDTWRSAYRGIVPDHILDGLSYADRESRHRRRLQDPANEAFRLAAESDSGEIGGFAIGGPSRSPDLPYDGELHALYVPPDHHREGIGRALVASEASQLLSGGTRSMLVWVFAANPARRFYEALGGQPIEQEAIVTIEDTELDEVPYGWDDLRTLVSGRKRAHLRKNA
jgi:GNAT superfamily N-acetyltransferase